VPFALNSSVLPLLIILNFTYLSASPNSNNVLSEGDEPKLILHLNPIS